MTAGREDLTVESDISSKDADRMLSFVETDHIPPPDPVKAPEQHEPERPIVEAEEQPEQEVKKTYTPEEEKEQQEEYAKEKLEEEQPEARQDEVSDEPVEDEDPIYAIRVDGAEEEVPLSELLRGYSRTADYTRKTQTLSNEKKTFEEERQAIREQRERYGQMLEQGKQWLDSMAPKEPNWEELRAKDPAEYAAQLSENQQRKDQNRLIQEEQQRLRQQSFEENQRMLAEHMKSERDRLVEALPEWKDPSKAKSEMEELQAFGATVGFSPEELDQVYDHRAVVVLRKAMLYDKLQSGKPQVVKRARVAPVLKPGASQAGTRKPAPTKLTRAREELRKTGSEKAAENFFFEALGEDI